MRYKKWEKIKYNVNILATATAMALRFFIYSISKCIFPNLRSTNPCMFPASLRVWFMRSYRSIFYIGKILPEPATGGRPIFPLFVDHNPWLYFVGLVKESTVGPKLLCEKLADWPLQFVHYRICCLSCLRGRISAVCKRTNCSCISNIFRSVHSATTGKTSNFTTYFLSWYVQAASTVCNNTHIGSINIHRLTRTD